MVDNCQDSLEQAYLEITYLNKKVVALEIKVEKLEKLVKELRNLISKVFLFAKQNEQNSAKKMSVGNLFRNSWTYYKGVYDISYVITQYITSRLS